MERIIENKEQSEKIETIPTHSAVSSHISESCAQYKPVRPKFVIKSIQNHTVLNFKLSIFFPRSKYDIQSICNVIVFK
jgi:hypothetical protein